MNNKGYTLLEVILALGLLSASLAGIITAYVTIDRSGMIALRHSQALLLQEYKLHDIVQENNSSQSASEGTFDSPFEEFHWKAVQGKEAQSGFKDVHVTIFWTVQGQSRELSASTYIRKKNESKK